MHRGPKGGDSLEDYFDVLRFGLPRMPALAHRLDKDTSGCLVLGRHRKALALLGKLFKNGNIGKTYWAVVEGGPEADEGRIDIALSKLDENRGWWMKPDPAGKPSSTVWKVMGRGDGKTWLALEPLRLRNAPINCACIAPRWAFRFSAMLFTAPRAPMGHPLHLHAREVVVPISKNKPPVVTTAPAPEHMREIAQSLRVDRRPPQAVSDRRAEDNRA